MLLDTSGLYSYFDKDDLYHVKAVEYFDASVLMLESLQMPVWQIIFGASKN